MCHLRERHTIQLQNFNKLQSPRRDSYNFVTTQRVVTYQLRLSLIHIIARVFYILVKYYAITFNRLRQMSIELF